MFLHAFIPSYHQVDSHSSQSESAASGVGGVGVQATGGATGGVHHHHHYKKSHFVYLIEVSTFGKYFRLEKRYSQFLALHNELRKSHRTPEFPPKKLRNTGHKLLEQRRQGLESYVQFFVRMNHVPQQLLDFLQVPKETVTAFTWEKPQHQPVAGFQKEPFLNPPIGDRLPNIITQATLDFFYN